MNYKEYIQSDEWKALRQKRLEKDGLCCILCKASMWLICHHLTYDNIFQEDINDLVILCHRCHVRVHRICPPRHIPKLVNEYKDERAVPRSKGVRLFASR